MKGIRKGYGQKLNDTGLSERNLDVLALTVLWVAPRRGYIDPCSVWFSQDENHMKIRSEVTIDSSGRWKCSVVDPRTPGVW
jgi:hypothetical protein